MRQQTKYLNPWHKPGHDEAYFVTTALPVEYRGFQIYQRVGKSADAVKNGVCVRQMATLQGGKNAVDAILDRPTDFLAQFLTPQAVAAIDAKKAA